MHIPIRYGTGNEFIKEYPDGTILADVLSDQEVKVSLGYGDNVDGAIGGVTQSDSLVLQDGMTIVVNDKACGKAGDEPRLSGRDMVRFLERKGFTLKRSKGHPIYVKAGYPPIPVPSHGAETLDYGTQRSIMKAAGLTKEDLH